MCHGTGHAVEMAMSTVRAAHLEQLQLWWCRRLVVLLLQQLRDLGSGLRLGEGHGLVLAHAQLLQIAHLRIADLTSMEGLCKFVILLATSTLGSCVTPH